MNRLFNNLYKKVQNFYYQDLKPFKIQMKISKAPTTSMHFRLKKHAFDAFSPIVHSKTTENDYENGGFRKRCRKMSHILSLPSVWTGENKTLVWAKIFCFVLVEKKTETFKNALV